MLVNSSKGNGIAMCRGPAGALVLLVVVLGVGLAVEETQRRDGPRTPRPGRRRSVTGCERWKAMLRS